MTAAESLDLDAYLRRIGHGGALDPTRATLDALHVAHLGAIPFENVDVYLGRPVRLDLDALEDKLVRSRRGGYCFEHNTLFAAVLRAIGFGVETLEARVRPPGATAILPRTHMVLRVTADGRRWLTDVGFGGDGPLLPVPFGGASARQPDGTYRIERGKDGVHVLQLARGSGWQDLYAFTTAPALPVDFEVANHYTSTHPRSRFVLTLTAQRSGVEQRLMLRDRTYTIRRGSKRVERAVAAGEIPALLTGVFGLDLSPDDLRDLVARLASDDDDRAD